MPWDKALIQTKPVLETSSYHTSSAVAVLHLYSLQLLLHWETANYRAPTSASRFYCVCNSCGCTEGVVTSLP